MNFFKKKEMKINQYEFGHVTNNAAMPCKVKTLQKSSSPEPVGRFS